MTTPSPTTERRHFQRVHFESTATLSQQGRNQAVELVDLSLNGVLVDEFDDAGFDLKKPLQLTLNLTDSVVISMDLICAHQEVSALGGNNKKCGFRCEGFDIDSATHLRRLVELNLGNSSSLDRDLSELILHSE